MRNVFVAFSMFASFCGSAMAEPIYKDLDYRGAVVKGHLGATEDFPSEFTDKLICEGGVSERSSKNSCLQINRDGSGTWENDAWGGSRQPPARIMWYLVTDQEGTPLRSSPEDRDIWQIIFEFQENYYSDTPGSLYAVPASYISSARRVVIHSKYRDF
ncbi:MAG: hypothetical protein WEA77_03175 [Hyphomonas sp.]|uniref:hypothetical protein n=1 Tax=Hyphomonas sp. TaxID=87 RepID=UPI0034A0561C